MSEQVKRKAADDNDDDDDFGDVAATTTTSATTGKKAKTSRPPNCDSSILGKDGQFFELARLRYARVSEWKGKKSVDIREYYIDDKDGDKLKAGKRGISLTPEQFDLLLEVAPDLKALLKK